MAAATTLHHHHQSSPDTFRLKCSVLFLQTEFNSFRGARQRVIDQGILIKFHKSPTLQQQEGRFLLLPTALHLLDKDWPVGGQRLGREETGLNYAPAA